MKNRSRPFRCSIADKVVSVTLRNGGGLQEPARVYVRCDERDCQYVDLNEAPCPLRVDMFADGSDRRTAEYLSTYPGSRACYACLTEVLGITHDQVRRASWRLKDEPGFSIRPGRCALCRRRRVTIALDAAMPPAAGPPSTVALPSAVVSRRVEPALVVALGRHLRERVGASFCAHCLARTLDTRPALVREAMFALDADPAFQIRTAQCASCLLTRPGIRHEGTSAVDAPRRVIGLLVQSAGTPSCATCVAFATDLALADARRILQYLGEVTEFERAEGACGACGRWQPTYRLRADVPADSERIDGLGAVMGGRFRHRGLRVDLLSFRTGDGWRPFALVKTGAGALIPDAPAIVLGIAATKAEADELAAHHAREWIDKRAS
jgi:hypothetical protein